MGLGHPGAERAGLRVLQGRARPLITALRELGCTSAVGSATARGKSVWRGGRVTLGRQPSPCPGSPISMILAPFPPARGRLGLRRRDDARRVQRERVPGRRPGARIGHLGRRDARVRPRRRSPRSRRSRLMSNVEKGARDVPVDTRLTLEADGGTLRKVTVTSAAGPVPGKMSGDNVTWVAGSLLEPGTAYAVTTVARRSDGADKTLRSTLPHRRPDPRPADLPLGGAARRRDRRRRHAGDRLVRRRGHRQGDHREAPQRHLHAQAARRLALDQRPRGALAARRATGAPAPT